MGQRSLDPAMGARSGAAPMARRSPSSRHVTGQRCGQPELRLWTTHPRSGTRRLYPARHGRRSSGSAFLGFGLGRTCRRAGDHVASPRRSSHRRCGTVPPGLRLRPGLRLQPVLGFREPAATLETSPRHSLKSRRRRTPSCSTPERVRPVGDRAVSPLEARSDHASVAPTFGSPSTRDSVANDCRGSVGPGPSGFGPTDRQGHLLSRASAQDWRPTVEAAATGALVPSGSGRPDEVAQARR